MANGYYCFATIWNKQKKEWDAIRTYEVSNFSSFGPNTYNFIKNNKVMAVFGLHEPDKPPTLIYPRFPDWDDDRMNRELQNNARNVLRKLSLIK